MQALTDPTGGPAGGAPAGDPPARPGAAKRSRPAWGIGAAVLALVTAAACGLLASLALSVLLPPGLAGTSDAPGAVLIAGVALAQALGALGVGAWATSPRRGRGGSGLAAEVGLRVRAVDLAAGAALALVALPVLGLAISLLVAAGLLDLRDVDNTSLLFAGAERGADFLLVAASAALLAPLWEEVMFRGLLLRSLRRRLGTVPGVVLSSAAFGLLHAQPGRGLALVLVTGALGVLFAVVTVRAGRLGPAIVAHAVFNGTTVLLAA